MKPARTAEATSADNEPQAALARVHAVLAAGVEQPRLLERWREAPEALRALGVAPETLDLAALGKFAGLSVKVRHNPLRAIFPLSFRLMSVAALEIAVFSAYAAHRSRLGLGFAPTMPARAHDLLEFLANWYDPDDRVHVLLWDALRYEAALARLGPWWTPSAIAAQTGSHNDHTLHGTVRLHETPRADTPCLRGEIVLLELRSDPACLAHLLHASTPDLSQIELLPADAAPLGVCVWRAPSADAQATELAVLTLDALGYALLSSIDGRRSVTQLTRRLRGGRGATAAVRAGLSDLAALGVIQAERAQASESRVCA